MILKKGENKMTRTKRAMLQDISDRIELMEDMLACHEVPYESIKIIENDLTELYARAMSIALN
jgi:hypothetical protein